jgi:gliding motility-associated-like protein
MKYPQPLYKVICICAGCLLLIQSQLNAQITAPDSVCVDEDFQPSTTLSGTSYYWHFCSGNLSYTPTIETVSYNQYLHGPAFMTVVQDSGNYYAFVTNNVDGTVVRYRYGSSLTNTPEADSLGNFGIIPKKAEGIQVKKDANGQWYGFVVGGIGDEALIRLSFGNSLRNTPVAYSLGNLGKMSYPVDLYLFQENGIWIGFVANYSSSTLTRIDFGNSLLNNPNFQRFNSSALINYPMGLCPVQENGNWHLFITNYDPATQTNSISRIDFGSSLLNNSPTGANLGSVPEISSPIDLAIVQDCGNDFGFVANIYGNTLVRIDFPQGITGPVTYTPMGDSSQLPSPHGISDIFRVGNEIFAFVANSDKNSISRVVYQTCNASSIADYTGQTPPPVWYVTEGNYNISLIVDNNQFYCKNIIVRPNPDIKLPGDTTLCLDDHVAYEVAPGYASYLWSDGNTGRSYVTDTQDTVWLDVMNNHYCHTIDTMIIHHYSDELDLGPDAYFTLGEAYTIDASDRYKTYLWSTAETTQTIDVIKPGDYSVKVTDVHNCNYRDTIHLSLQYNMNNFITPNGDGANDVWYPKVFFHYPEADIRIFDRYGKTIAHYKGSDAGWNGTYNGKPVEPDTYWYVVDLKNGIEPFTGQITVKR